MFYESFEFDFLISVLNFEGMNKSFTVFGFEITVYGILVAVGMLFGLAVIMLQVRKHKENPNLYLGMVLISLIGGLIGARLYYLAFSWESFSGKPWTELINIRRGRTCNIWRNLRRRAGRIYLL